MIDILIYGFPAVVIIIGLTQIVKKFVDSRYMPLVAIVLGMLIMVLGDWKSIEAETFVQGIVLGLVSCGLWDVGKTTITGGK